MHTQGWLEAPETAKDSVFFTQILVREELKKRVSVSPWGIGRDLA